MPATRVQRRGPHRYFDIQWPQVFRELTDSIGDKTSEIFLALKIPPLSHQLGHQYSAFIHDSPPLLLLSRSSRDKLTANRKGDRLAVVMIAHRRLVTN